METYISEFAKAPQGRFFDEGDWGVTKVLDNMFKIESFEDGSIFYRNLKETEDFFSQGI